MQPLPIGIQDFAILRRENFLYVDKTELIYRLIQVRQGIFFSRPRRFGKSLLLSTIASLLKGERELFNDLWIANSSYNWPTYPIIQLDLSEVFAHSVELLKSSLNQRLIDVANHYAIDIQPDPYPAESFLRLIKNLDNGNGVVVLIDEYDHPLLSHLKNRELTEKNRMILHDFFSIIKSQGKHIRFAFVTGVSKFTKVSLFSGMNNLKDISFSPEFGALAGMTEAEVDTNYIPYLKRVSDARGETIDETKKQIKLWYNGYNFASSKQATPVYNPVSLHLFLDSGTFKHFWFSTATPTFAIEHLQEQSYPVIDLENGVSAGPELEEQHELHQMNLIPLLYQTGYLTIASYEERTGKYHLTFPNLEVRHSFMHHLLTALTNLSNSQINPHITMIKKALQDHNFPLFTSYINGLFAEIPYTLHIQKESYYHSLIYLIFRGMQLEVQPEVLTSHGRLDLAISLDRELFIFEFKMDCSAQTALEQILQKKYHERYTASYHTITLVGINMNGKQKKIVEYKELQWKGSGA